MARIRTIKPEFWTSEQVVDCSPTARLLFIGMWNFADDGGNIPASSKTLKMQIFPGDDLSPDDVSELIDELMVAGLVVEYAVGTKHFWHITGWKHQKIEKPSFKYPPINDGEIIDHSLTIRRQIDDRHPAEGKGMERNGKERSKSKALQAVDSEIQTSCRSIWSAYADAYATRYGVAPIRNAKVNSQVKRFAQLMPANEAAAVAAHYVQHNGQFYVAKLHPLELLVSDAAKLRTEWATGLQMTSTRARQQDRTSSMLAIVEEIKRERGEA